MKKHLPACSPAVVCFLFLAIMTHYVFSRSLFLSPTTDSKELFLYSGALVLMLGFFFFNKPLTVDISNRMNLLQIGCVVYLVYRVINPFLHDCSWYESFIQTSQLAILFCVISLLAPAFKEHAKSLLLTFLCLTFPAIAATFCLSVFSGWGLPIGHVSYLSDVILMQIPFGLYLLFQIQSKIKKILVVIWMAFGLVFLIALARRTSCIALVVALLCMGLVACFLTSAALRNKINASIAGVILFFLFVAFVFALVPVDNRGIPNHSSLILRLAGTEQNMPDSLDIRKTIFARCTKAIKTNPITGWGYGNFKFVYPRFFVPGDAEPAFLAVPGQSGWLMHPHNQLLFEAFEGGLLGAVLFFLLPAIVIVFLIKRIRKVNEPDCVLALTAFGSLIAILISQEGNSSILSPVVKVNMVLVFGLAYGLVKDHLPSIGIPRKTGYKLARVCFFLDCFLLGGMIINEKMASYLLATAQPTGHRGFDFSRIGLAQKIGPLSFQVLQIASMAEQAKGNHMMVLKLLETAHRNFPYVPSIANHLAKAYLQLGEAEKAKTVVLELKALFPYYPTISL